MGGPSRLRTGKIACHRDQDGAVDHRMRVNAGGHVEGARTMPAFGALLDRLGDSLEELAEDTCAQIYREVDSYERITREALRSAVARNLQTALTALQDERVPRPETLDGAAQTAFERYHEGVPVEDIVRGFRISISLINERFIDLAVSLGLPAELTVRGSRIMWRVGDAFTTRIITEYHALEVEAALRNAQRRTELVHRLLGGEIPGEAVLLGIDPQAQYAALCCDVPAGTNADTIRQRLEARGARGAHRALVVLESGQCLGVVAARPDVGGFPIGLGPFVRPEDLPRSERTARQALKLAQRLGRKGVQSLEDLGWRLAAASRTDVWETYFSQFLAPVLEQGPFGDEILATVRTWLANGHSAQRTAEALTVHVNTVRYRLRRYEALTLAALDDADDVVAITWALELGDPSSYAL